MSRFVPADERADRLHNPLRASSTTNSRNFVAVMSGNGQTDMTNLTVAIRNFPNAPSACYCGQGT